MGGVILTKLDGPSEYPKFVIKLYMKLTNHKQVQGRIFWTRCFSGGNFALGLLLWFLLFFAAGLSNSKRCTCNTLIWKDPHWYAWFWTLRPGQAHLIYWLRHNYISRAGLVSPIRGMKAQNDSLKKKKKERWLTI